MNTVAQVVDMRWGVPEHASDSHSTTELCLQEINKCQEVSAGPNFVVFILIMAMRSNINYTLPLLSDASKVV